MRSGCDATGTGVIRPMLDHFPTSYEVAMAEQAFQMGRASCDDIEILRITHPERNYAPCDPIGGLFDILGGGFVPW